jgi:hypothetical protein
MTHADAIPAEAAYKGPEPALMTTTLHIGAEHVSATDLTERHRASTADPTADLVALTLGDNHARVVLLGSLTTVDSVLSAASTQLDDIDAQRQPRRGTKRP